LINLFVIFIQLLIIKNYQKNVTANFGYLYFYTNGCRKLSDSFFIDWKSVLAKQISAKQHIFRFM